MRNRLVVFIPVVILLLLGGVLILPSASGKTDLNLVFGPPSEVTERTLDYREDGLRPADRIQARGPLYDESRTTLMGTAYIDCVVHKRIVDPAKGLWGCNYVLELADGDIVVQGLDPRGPGAYKMAVLGGTGAYAGASGDADFNDVVEEHDVSTHIAIHLITP